MSQYRASEYRFSSDLPMSHTLAEANVLKAGSDFNAGHQPRPRLDALQVLPLEILHMILLLLDLPSLVTFRALSRTALRTVNSLPEYRALIVGDGRRILRDVLVIGQGYQFTCSELCRKIQPTACDNLNCEEVKTSFKKPLYMFFPTRQQLCMECINKIETCYTMFHEFGIEKPRGLDHYTRGRATPNPREVVALRFEYPYQTISAPHCSDAVKMFLERVYPGGMFDVPKEEYRREYQRFYVPQFQQDHGVLHQDFNNFNGFPWNTQLTNPRLYPRCFRDGLHPRTAPVIPGPLFHALNT